MNAIAQMAEMAAAESKRARETWAQGVRKQTAIVFADIPSVNAAPFDEIVARISEETGVSVSDIMGKTRTKLPARARHFAMWQAQKLGYPLKEIGQYFNRDHTTILHAVRNINGIMGL